MLGIACKETLEIAQGQLREARKIIMRNTLKRAVFIIAHDGRGANLSICLAPLPLLAGMTA
jgi:hypothetical protein